MVKRFSIIQTHSQSQLCPVIKTCLIFKQVKQITVLRRRLMSFVRGAETETAHPTFAPL